MKSYLPYLSILELYSILMNIKKQSVVCMVYYYNRILFYIWSFLYVYVVASSYFILLYFYLFNVEQTVK